MNGFFLFFPNTCHNSPNLSKIKEKPWISFKNNDFTAFAAAPVMNKKARGVPENINFRKTCQTKYDGQCFPKRKEKECRIFLHIVKKHGYVRTDPISRNQLFNDWSGRIRDAVFSETAVRIFCGSALRMRHWLRLRNCRYRRNCRSSACLPDPGTIFHQS